MDNELKKEIISLVENAKTAYVSSVNEHGYPNTKAMFALKHDGLDTHYFSTNTSSKRVKQFINNQKACIYFCNEDNFMGLMLVGIMEVTRDKRLREMLWFDGCEMYYPLGVDDEDYSVLKFTAEWGNYYHGLQNQTFSIEELN
jgi:general stress protein 26